VREYQLRLDRADVLRLRLQRLGPQVEFQSEHAAILVAPLHPQAVRAGTLREHKEVAERAFLVQKLRETGWNISKTAEVIDTPRSNLYKKLEQYGISQETDG